MRCVAALRRGVGVAVLLLALLAQPCIAQKTFKNWYFGRFVPDEAGLTTLVKTEDFHLMKNLWFHVNRFYAVVDTPSFDDPQYQTDFTDLQWSQNVGVTRLPLADPPAFFRGVEAGWVAGTVLWLDFPFPALSGNMAHWAELLLPVYSALRSGAWKAAVPEGGDAHYVRAVLFPSLGRDSLQALPWVMDMVKLALRPGLREGQSLPRVLFWDELAGLNGTQWLGFQRVLQVLTRYKHPAGRSAFAAPEDGAAFRAAAYAAANVTAGRRGDWGAAVPPRSVTFMLGVGKEEVANSGEVLGVLREVAGPLGLSLRPYSATAAVPFSSLVATMAGTGLLVARSGPLLANAIFLPPGAMVLELLPFNWEWGGLSEVSRNLTRSLADIHHFGWRAPSAAAAAYASEEDAKYAGWRADECTSRGCLEAHDRAAVVADIPALRALLRELLPRAVGGEGVESLAARVPWPRAAPRAKGGTGLWWEVQ